MSGGPVADRREGTRWQKTCRPAVASLGRAGMLVLRLDRSNRSRQAPGVLPLDDSAPRASRSFAHAARLRPTRCGRRAPRSTSRPCATTSASSSGTRAARACGRCSRPTPTGTARRRSRARSSAPARRRLLRRAPRGGGRAPRGGDRRADPRHGRLLRQRARRGPRARARPGRLRPGDRSRRSRGSSAPGSPSGPIDVHLKIDTGMARLGVDHARACPRSRRSSRDFPEVRVRGLMTHLACADDADERARPREQMLRFDEATALLARHGVRADVRHAANSAALLRGDALPRRGASRASRSSASRRVAGAGARSSRRAPAR